MQVIYIIIFLIAVSILFIIIFGSNKFPFYSFYATKKINLKKNNGLDL
ncbi:hypothetical protein QJ854_gp230 [Moumouvirus goulette]|uniref:Uncharacterized protein n=1 Tax=Moumouvirus goulette TaxID=1247379 RepID=M1PXQ4_9VIRU|nr:hypothetical protein QJ854_gp230 [Moumouvirus goulette]AGF85552.1 hypothetical protein glt_00747 [Moumouvirus goulette]